MSDTQPLLYGEPVIIDPEKQQIRQDEIFASQIAREEMARSQVDPHYYYYGTWRHDPTLPRRRPIIYVEDEIYVVWMWVFACLLLWFVCAAVGSTIYWYSG